MLVVNQYRIDGLFVLLVEHPDGQPRLQRYLERTCQSVAATAGDNTHAGVGAAKAIGHIVHRAVAAAGHHTVVAFVSGLACNLGAVMDMLGIFYAVVEQVLVEVLLELGLYSLLPADAGNGVYYYKSLCFHKL